MSKTKIITIEGIDGSGKTVQFELLTKGLQDRGFTVQKRAYPVYDAFFGEQVGKFLSCSEGVSASTVDQKSMALWFAMDRFMDFRNYRDGEADFLLLYTTQPIYDRLLAKGILIRNCENFRGLGEGYYRIAVKKQEENEVLLRELAMGD